MCQNKKDRCMFHANLSKLLVGGAFLLATSPVYATGRNHSDSYAVNSSLIVQQQGRTVTGIVIDDKGETIIGANVMVKGTTNGSITNIDGQFTLNNSARRRNAGHQLCRLQGTSCQGRRAKQSQHHAARRQRID